MAAFRAGEGVDLGRDAVRMVMQELTEAEATERIGAVLADTHDEWQVGDRYNLAEGSMSKLCPECDPGAVAEHNPGD